MYFQGFVVPVPGANKQAYLDMAKQAAPIFAEHGGLGLVECWGDDVMDGKVTDFRKAVRASDDETVVLSWVWWPDKATCDAAAAKLMADDRMKPDGPMPFDGQRMIHGGFEVSFDTGDGGGFGYVDGVVASVADDHRQGFVDHAVRTSRFFKQQGALRVVDGWGIDVPAGKVTDFRRAVQARDGETVVFGWIEWPDKATRDAAMKAIQSNAAMMAEPMPFDGKRMIFGGFAPVVTLEAERD
jgi:uncharacterized protein YbaA (DUF1428 family)